MGLFDRIIEALDEATLSGLVKPDMGEALDLTPVVERLRQVRRELENGNDLPVDSLPLNLYENIASPSDNYHNAVKNLIGQMQQYGPNTGSPNQERTGMLRSARGLFDTAVVLRPYVAVQQSDLRGAEVRYQALIDELESRLEDVRQAQAARAVSSGVAASTELASEYREQAATHRVQANWFAGGAAVAGVALAGAAIALLSYQVPKSPTTYQAAHDGAIRLVILSLFSVLLGFCLRNFRVNRHLHVLNRRREQALNTFGPFQQAVTTEEMRNVVVTELVRAIFAHDATGYISEPPDRTPGESSASLATLIATQGRGREIA